MKKAEKQSKQKLNAGNSGSMGFIVLAFYYDKVYHRACQLTTTKFWATQPLNRRIL